MRKTRAPRRAPSKAGSQRRKAAARSQRILSAEQFEYLAEHLEKADDGNLASYLAGLRDTTWLVEGARARNVRLAEWLLRVLVEKLKKKQPLRAVERTFLAEALETIIPAPATAGQALGLVAPKWRPSNGISARDWRIHRFVRSQMEAGIPFKDGSPTKEWNGEGAVTRASAKLHVSPSTVKRAYGAVRKLDQLMEPESEHLDRILASI
jgi:hypothetical protein